MHSQLHVFWAWYVFLNEYTTYFSFSGAHSRQKYGFTALLLPYWSKYEQTLKHPPEGELQACWGPYTTPVITAILDVILKPMQSYSVGYWLFSCQIFRIIDQHLLLSWADLHVFYTILTAIFGLNNFCSDM